VLLAKIEESVSKTGDSYSRFKVREAVKNMMDLARAGNKYFNENEPWVTRKRDNERCATTLNLSLQSIKTLAVIAAPILPFTSEKIWKVLNQSETLSWEQAGVNDLKAGHDINIPEVLFEKIEDEQIEEQEQKLNGS